MQKSKIEWTDATFNYWEGCTKVGPGCDNCYAENRNARFSGGTADNWGAGAPRKKLSGKNARQPIRWNRRAAAGFFVQCDSCGLREFRKWDNSVAPGGLSCCSNEDCFALPESESTPVRPRVFCSSLSDWLDNEVPVEWLAELLDIVRITTELDWLLLTKRIGNFDDRMQLVYEHVVGKPDFFNEGLAEWLVGWLTNSPPPNVWVGATVVNQKEANRDIPKLLKVPAKIHFLSIEPMIGFIDLEYPESAFPEGPARCCSGHDCGCYGKPIEPPMFYGVDWIICGGESGPNARPLPIEWVRRLRDQCEVYGVPFLFKQWGEFLPYEMDAPTDFEKPLPKDLAKVLNPATGKLYPGNYTRPGKKEAGRLLDGRTWDGFPEPKP